MRKGIDKQIIADRIGESCFVIIKPACGLTWASNLYLRVRCANIPCVQNVPRCVCSLLWLDNFIEESGVDVGSWDVSRVASVGS